MHIFHYGLSLELLDTPLHIYFHMYLNLLFIKKKKFIAKAAEMNKKHTVCPMHFSIKSLRTSNNF